MSAELRVAVAKLIKAKGRFHTEQNYAELVRVFDATAAAPAQGELTDAARLEFMMEREAWIAWSKDGESCRLFHRNEDDGEPMPMLGWGARHWSHDPREAVDAARAAIQAQAGDAPLGEKA